MQKWSMRALTVFLTCLILSACAGKEIANTEAIQQQSVLEANNSKFTPEQAIKVAETKYSDAIKAELNVFAPIHLSQAKESIAQAREFLQKTPKDTTDTALKAAIAAQKFIDNAYINKKTVQANLKEVLAHNAELIKLQAPTRLSTQYKKVHAQLLDLIKLIEEGLIADAIRGQAPLLAEMSKLEIKTLHHTHLSEVESLIEKARDINGDKYAQVSFKKAVKLSQAAKLFISKNYRNRKQVKKIGAEALWAAKHAFFVSLESQKIMQLEPSESEQYILSLIAHLNSISQIASAKDLAPQALSSANTQLLTMVSNLKVQLKASQQQLTNTKVTDTTTLLNTILAPDDDEVIVLRTFPPMLMEGEEPSLSEEQDAVDEPRFQVDEQGFDDFEQMTNDE